MAKFMTHMNHNLLCAVDVETTGFDPKRHEIIQICVLPLDSNIQPLKEYMPFYIDLKPNRVENIDPEAIEINKSRLAKLILAGLDQDCAVDLFYNWFQKLNLGQKKKIVPLAHNWPFDRSFIINWLGHTMFDECFHFHYRDTMANTLYCNDRADFNNEKCPYPKHGLKYLATTLGVDYEEHKLHDAMADCIVTAEVYRRLMKGVW